uniref:Uncharacterized protein n=1 Tax=Trichobilharzia regenti TaxID=157069 RepID=A0AA85JHI3_TRIRE|nr:unnamed protein product [Trichobilharzia regenti]
MVNCANFSDSDTQVDILMTSETPEQKITNLLQQVTEKLGEYFTKIIEDKCSSLKKKDGLWFNETVEDLISEFEKSTSGKCAEILSQYDINSNADLVKMVNKKRRKNKSWRPSGDPVKDIKAYLLPVNISFVEDLYCLSQELQPKASKGLADLKKLRATLYDEMIELKSIPEKLEKLTKKTELGEPQIPDYFEPNQTLSPSK